MAYFIRRISDGKYSSGGQWFVYFQDENPFRYETFKGIRSSIKGYIKNIKNQNGNFTEKLLLINVYENLDDFEVLDFEYQTLSVKQTWTLRQIMDGLSDVS